MLVKTECQQLVVNLLDVSKNQLVVTMLDVRKNQLVVTLLDVSKNEKDGMILHLPTESLKTRSEMRTKFLPVL